METGGAAAGRARPFVFRQPAAPRAAQVRASRPCAPVRDL